MAPFHRRIPGNHGRTVSDADTGIGDWQKRPLDEVYPVVYIDAIHYSVRDNGCIRKLAAYVILGINTERKKEVVSITIEENESANSGFLSK